MKTGHTSVVKAYPAPVRWLHWVMAVIGIGMIVLGLVMTSLDKTVTYKYELYAWHKSFGIVMLILIIARVITRYILKAPPLPGSLPAVVMVLSVVSHKVLYALLIIVPLSGYIMSNPYGISFFSLGKVPVIFARSNAFTSWCHTVHIWMAWALMILIIVHILAAVLHVLAKNPEHNILKRMRL